MSHKNKLAKEKFCYVVSVRSINIKQIRCKKIYTGGDMKKITNDYETILHIYKLCDCAVESVEL